MKQAKPKKNQKPNVFSDKCMTIYNDGGQRRKEKNEGNLNGVEEKVVGGGGDGKTVE